jgi:hypothetical protein
LTGDEMLQRLPIEEFHGDKGLAVLLANVVDRADIGMIQGRSGVCFALKAGQRLRVLCDPFGQKFEGYKAV